jgi:glycosyltransferase involved in cell wall biosynthesis
MKISIITVSYNSEQTISKTIESICGQTYLTHTECQLEYLIIDGNSSDRTVAVAESYRDRLQEAGVSYTVLSEPDKGIYDAMNKGIRLASGDIIGIINSDDWYEPDALETVKKTFEAENCELMYANICMHRDDGSTFVKRARLRTFETSRDWNHPTTFVRADIYKENPFKNLGIHDDYGFFLQMKRQKRKIVVVDKVLANFRMGGASNNKSLKAAKKRIKDRYLYCYRINGYSRLYIIECIAIEAAKWILG